MLKNIIENSAYDWKMANSLGRSVVQENPILELAWLSHYTDIYDAPPNAIPSIGTAEAWALNFEVDDIMDIISKSSNSRARASMVCAIGLSYHVGDYLTFSISNHSKREANS